MPQDADNPQHSTSSQGGGLARQRDGTSQADRDQAALDPDYVAVDERSLKDLLIFVREYAKDLQYFGVEGDSVKAMGDWSAFLDSETNLDEVVAFMQDPSKLPADRVSRYSRPHFALLLTFLQLLRHAQDQLNTLTRRHLDFYYQQVLHMTRQLATPDQVNALIDLAPDTEACLLPAGTLLNAGADSLGRPLLYSTNRDIVVNQAQIEQCSSVYVDTLVTGIREARADYLVLTGEALVNMMGIALGDPDPGDPLPHYPRQSVVNTFTGGLYPLPIDSGGFTVDAGLLHALRELIEFLHTGLYLEFAEFRSLMRLKNQRDHADAEWAQINAILTKAGRRRTGNPKFRLKLADPRDFDANLKEALGNPADFDTMFADIRIDNIYDAYAQRIREDVQRAVREHLYLEMADFEALMQIKVRIDAEWAEINRILAAAGQRKKKLKPGDGFPAKDATAFEENLDAALGPLAYPQRPEAITTLDSYYAAFLRLEGFFFMAAENFAELISMVTSTGSTTTEAEWEKAYRILAEAYKEKVYETRRAQLNAVRGTTGFTPAQAYAAMVSLALGEDLSEALAEGSLDKLERYLPQGNTSDDAGFLRIITQQLAQGQAMTEADWVRLIRILERVERARLPEPVAQKIDWLNLYANEDATSIQATPDDDPPRWKTFGQGQPSVAPDSPAPRSFGWAITSPLLALSGGQRKIILRLGFAETDPDDIRSLFAPSQTGSTSGPIAITPGTGPFCIQVSTAKGWIEPDTITVDTVTYRTGSATSLPGLEFTLRFAENVDPLSPPAPGKDHLASDWPVLKLMLRQVWRPSTVPGDKGGRYITEYPHFKGLALIAVYLKVEVVGLTPLQIQNDETRPDPAKPFEPFGSRPVVGSRFYVGHPELSLKKLTSLTFHAEWMGIPANLLDYYKNYPNITSSTSFTAQISLIDSRLEIPISAAAPLFASIVISDVPGAVESAKPGYSYEGIRQPVIDDDLLAWDRYLQWELNSPDFQHGAYPAVATQKATELSTAIATNTVKRKSTSDPTPDVSHYQVNPPYTPKIKHLSVDYTASTEILMESYVEGSQDDRIFHIQPLGYNEIYREAGAPYYAFLPQYDDEGQLYIGIGHVSPPQNLAILFQMAEGSADPDLEPVAVQWSYLDHNRWISLDDGRVLQDTTRGLINSGIIELSLAATQPSTLLPANRYWIRAVIPRHSGSICDTIAIHTQAASATFTDHGNALDHLSQPLAAGSIARLAEPLPEIVGIRQPYTSFGGKMPEQDRTFYRRISERLRHKQRALTLWDYERLILERFPEIYKVKCLPADANNPGKVEVIVIPDMKNKRPFNPFEPKTAADLIANIEAYLQAYVPTFAAVTVKNAHYVPVKVRLDVRFSPGGNEGYYRQRLNDELNRFLSPWAYADGADIVIGGRIYANAIINFVEKRPYVDFVANIKLFSSEDGMTFKASVASGEEGYWIETGRPDGVLVAARQHEIGMIPEAGFEEEDFTGINYMKIELDFRVG